MTISGEMGKGGKSPVETKDSLVSDQIAKVLFVVGEGLIDSIENVYLDTTEITAFDAEYDWRDGSGSQSVIGFSDGDGFIANESSLPGFASKLIDHGAGTVETFDDAIDHIETIPYEADCKSVRLTFSIPVMSYLDPDGNLVGSEVEIGIYTRPSTSGLWTLYANPIKKGKTTNGYSFDIIVPRPTTTTPWQINVKRKTKDSTSTKKQNKINLAMITQVYQDLNLTYNNSALVGVKIKDPTQFGNRIPEVMFRIKGKKVTIPSNYDANTRIYTGVWDGTFNTLTKYYTNNPAWILLDVLTDTRSGLGIDIADIDKYAIYNLAKYCDETIDDGLGGTIPRYTLDYQFQERQGVSQFLAQILSICNANIITNEFGQISVVYIYPNQVIKRNVTNANVVDGSFTYQSSGLEARTTLANVTYNNGLNFGRTDTATVSDDDLITRYGLQVIDVVLPGCYHEAQAIRKARYTLFSNCYFVNFVSFSVFLDGLTYKIGDLIRIFDNYNQNETKGGLAASIVNAGGNTTITFDRPCALDAGSYTFNIYDTDGTVHTKSVTGGSTISSVVFDSTITIATGAPFVFSGPAAGKIYRVTDIQKSEDSLYAVTALEWSELIFDYIDGDITIVPKSGDYANLSDLSTSPVINLNIAQNFGSNGTYRTSNLIVSWLWDVANAQKYTAKFKLAYSKDGGQQHIVENINTDTYAIPNPFPGVYEITVWAVNPVTGFLSTPVNTTYNFRTSVAASTLQPPVNLVVAGTAGTTFSTRDVTIAWESNPDNALATVEDVLHDYVVELYDQTATLYGTYSVPRQNAVSTVDPYDSTTTYWQLPGSFTLPFADNYAYFGTAKRQLTFAVYARDTIGDLSDPAWVTVNNPPPVFTSLAVDTGIGSVNVKIGVSSEPDVKDYLVYRGASAGFTPSSANLVYRGSNNQIVIKTPDNNNYYYKAAISDSFGEDSLNYSTAVSQSSYAVTNGMNTAIVYIYKRSATVPSNPSAIVTYTFSTNAVTGLNNGWTATIPAGSEPLYVTTAVASSLTDTDSIASSEWATAVILSQNGVNGSNGANGTNGTNGVDGLNSSAVFLYQRTSSSTPPAVPSATVTYTFSTGVATGLTNGWTQSMPTTGGSYRWMTQASAIASTATDAINTTEWNTPSIIAQDGVGGSNNALVYIYKRSATVPSNPSAIVTYTFSTNAVTGLNNGWTATIPAGSEPLYVTTAVASSLTDTDSIASSEWATAVILSQNGVNGSNGANGTNGTNGVDGLNSSAVFLYQRTSSSTPPAVPASSLTYTFSNGLLSGTLGNWSQTMPTTGGSYRWMTQASAIGYGTQDVILSGEWSAVALLAQDGANGTNGTNGVDGTNGVNGAMTYKIYYKATNQGTPPSTPSNTTNGATPAGWSSSPVTLTGVEAQFESDGSQAAGSTTTVWSTPYLSYFKVNKLEAITAQMGALTVDDKLTVSTGGKIASGQTAYDTGTGYWLEYNAGTPRFSLGNSSNGIAWDGSALNVRGNVIATDNINSDAITKKWKDIKTTPTAIPTATSGGNPSSAIWTSNIDSTTETGTLIYHVFATFYNSHTSTNYRVQYALEILNANSWYHPFGDEYPIVLLDANAASTNFKSGSSVINTAGSCHTVSFSIGGLALSGSNNIGFRVRAWPNANNTSVYLLNAGYTANLYKR